MAKGRRPTDLRDTLGSFVQSALEQVGVVRDVVERGAAAQRGRYESVKLERQRRDALAELGEAVYRLAIQGRLGAVADAPELRSLLSGIDDLDQRIEVAADQPDDDAAFEARSGFPTRRRDAVSSGAVPGRPARQPAGGDVRVWRPVPPSAAEDAAPAEAHASQPLAAEPEPRVWRPSVDDVPEPTAPAAASAPSRDAAPASPAAPQRAAGGAGPIIGEVAEAAVAGIRFDADWDDEWRDEYEDDGDLEEYMHADDVPAAAEPGGADDAAADAGSDAAPEATPRQRRRRGPERA